MIGHSSIIILRLRNPLFTTEQTSVSAVAIEIVIIGYNSIWKVSKYKLFQNLELYITCFNPLC